MNVNCGSSSAAILEKVPTGTNLAPTCRGSDSTPLILIGSAWFDTPSRISVVSPIMHQISDCGVHRFRTYPCIPWPKALPGARHSVLSADPVSHSADSNPCMGTAFWKLLFGLAVFIASPVVLRVLRFFWRCATSPLRQPPGPVSVRSS